MTYWNVNYVKCVHFGTRSVLSDVIPSLLLLVAIAKCQRARKKHEDDRKAMQALRTGALILLFEKKKNFKLNWIFQRTLTY